VHLNQSMPAPAELSVFCGEVVATDHTEEVSGSSMDGSGSIWTDVHREVWIRRHDGLERKFSFTNVDLPSRQGQRVVLLLDGARPVALVNFSTEQHVNLVALNQFELFGAAEAFAFAAMLVVAGFTAPTGIVALLIGAMAYGLVKHRARKRRFSQRFALVEAQIQRTIAHPPATLAQNVGRPA
jgi:hypothetical protein